MGAFYVAPSMAIDIVEAYLSADLGTDWEWWPNFYEFHKLAYDELNEFDYETFKANGFEFPNAIDIPLDACDKPEELKYR